MKRTCRALLLTGAALLVWSPAPASADGFISPWVAANFGHGLDDGGRGSYGFNAGYMGNGIIGGEFDFGYSPRFFGDQAVFGSNNVLSAMGNVIVGIPVGGTTGQGARPFATAGVGLIRSDVDGLFEGSNASNDFGFNVGGGVMGYFSDHFGVKGEVRYFRTVNDNSTPNNFDLDLGGLHYWRAAVGLVIR
ncbi:MAG TPA: outer membrane beta-barrel protein [Vicinamibacterales bacterium]|nr:outer membrane beta-barrel protein [Vicinamibacterales bacterium]